MNRLYKILKSEAGRNSILSVSEALIAPVFIVILLPVFLHVLGSEKYGIYVLVSSFSALVGSLNLGGAITTTRFISQFRGQNRKDKIGEFSSTIFVFQLVLFSVFTAVFLSSIGWIKQGFFSNSDNANVLEKLLFFAIPVFFIDLFEQNYNGLHKGYERFDRALIMSFISKFVRYTAQLLAILMLKSLIGIYFVLLISSFGFFLIHSIVCKFWYSDVRFFTHFRVSMLKEFLSFSLWTWLSSVIGALFSQVDKWVIVGAFDLRTVGFYGIASNVYIQIHSITSSSVSWIFPKVAFTGIYDGLKSFYARNRLRLSTMVCVMSIVLLLSSRLIFGIWLGKDYEFVKEYLNLFICILPLLSTTIMPYHIMYGLGKSRLMFWLTLYDLFMRTSCFFLAIKFFGDIKPAIISLGINFFLISFIYNHVVLGLIGANRTFRNYVLDFGVLAVSSLLIFIYF